MFGKHSQFLTAPKGSKRIPNVVHFQVLPQYWYLTVYIQKRAMKLSLQRLGTKNIHDTYRSSSRACLLTAKHQASTWSCIPETSSDGKIGTWKLETFNFLLGQFFLLKSWHPWWYKNPGSHHASITQSRVHFVREQRYQRSLYCWCFNADLCTQRWSCMNCELCGNNTELVILYAA